MMNRSRHLRIDPATRGGSFTIDEAFDVGLFEDVVGYEIRSPGYYGLVYNDGSRGRAVVTCYGFELMTLGYEEL